MISMSMALDLFIILKLIMSVVTVFVQSDNASSERRFDKGLTIRQLKVIFNLSFYNLFLFHKPNLKFAFFTGET